MKEADQLSKWPHCQEKIRQNLENILFVHVAPRETLKTKGINSCNLTRAARLKLALNAIKNRQILAAFRLAVLPEIKRKSPRAAIQTGHLLKDAGELDLALVTYAKVAINAQDENMVYEALFNLGHCAKIAGKYGVGVEAFASTLQLRPNETGSEKPSLEDLNGTLECLTKSFRISS